MIYDLEHDYFLWEDISFIIAKIKVYYDIKFDDPKLKFISKMVVPDGIYWASQEAIGYFNRLVPQIKSLHNDMYRVLESAYNAKNSDEFYWKNLVGKYPIIEQFTYLNNRFKHYRKKHGLTINLISVVNGIGSNQKIELLCSFIDSSGKSESIFFNQFIEFFLNYLQDLGLISFKSTLEENE